ncbi:hypothetical protein BDV36DRAFT_60769 [Aspergillus pseudocaelatus]|uniref:Uncharacterized protein n=1 Tax=Aspergillus pseudocaelatus TaxID=1825620 RepID=A0ABQ6W880_9EURO|nr:hypothetical protein BDV36DRAFT_60769 [Aspergillus pseudocaelatus]
MILLSRSNTRHTCSSTILPTAPLPLMSTLTVTVLFWTARRSSSMRKSILPEFHRRMLERIISLSQLACLLPSKRQVLIFEGAPRRSLSLRG